MKQILFYLLLLFFSISNVEAKDEKIFNLPKPSAKDTISLLKLPKKIQAFSVRDFTLSPNKDEIFITLESNKNTIATILQFKKIKKKWKMEIAPFSGIYYDLEAQFSPDGNHLYFVSNRPLHPDSTLKDFDIWQTEKINGIWQNPTRLSEVVNTSADEFYPSVSADGTLYFTAQYKHSKGKEDIWKSEKINGNYSTPVSISDSINTEKYEFNAFVNKDENLIVFTSCGRADDFGGCDLYISKKDSNGNWKPAKNIGASINSTALDYCPFISADNSLFVFTSNRSKLQKKFSQKLNIDSLIKEIGQIQNGKGNLYWMNAADILNEL
ncbi:MAG: PD40 domain-containing protein [Chitinophagales bacterium]|nr:PD40 domain-containing protein [Chitinophagales bacterium]MBP6153882.1 PD40 domain-containing protein [Chitinophagales bacterium]